MRKQLAPLVMTVIVIILIICIAGIARWSLKLSEEKTVPVASGNLQLIDDKGLNGSERRVLAGLTEMMDFTKERSLQEIAGQTIYFNYLREYYKSSGVELREEAADEIEIFINEKNALINLEQEKSLSKMSFDGREVAIHILKQIYQLSGLELVMNMDGEIEQITDLSGTMLYRRNNLPDEGGFRLDALIIIILSMLILISVCYIIAKKNQLFEKDGDYYGYNKKKVA